MRTQPAAVHLEYQVPLVTKWHLGGTVWCKRAIGPNVACMGALEGKAALVTGGGSGIGRASARRLAAEGASVLVVDLVGERAEQVAEEVGGSFMQADVSSPEDWARMVERAESTMGGIDVAHLNAGVTTGEQEIAKLSIEQYRRIVGANLDGVVLGVRAVVPTMARRGGGAIVATASLAGLIAFGADPIYTMTKHAVVGLVRSLPPQLHPLGITVNAVCPGLVDTPLLAGPPKEALEQAGFPLIDPNDVAEAVLGCVTGQDSGQAIVIQAGLDPVPFHFGRVPGPRLPGAEGRLPPGMFAAHDQVQAAARGVEEA